MSISFSQYIIYGVRKTYAEYEQWLKVQGIKEEDEDKQWANNREDDLRWVINDGGCILGKIIMWPGSNGKDNLLACENGAGLEEIDLLEVSEELRIQSFIADQTNHAHLIDAKYYVMGLWS